MTTAVAGRSRTLAAELPSAAPGRPVLIEGWVHRRRALGAVTFLIVRDRSGLAQVVVRNPEALAAARRCGEESVVAVTGVATRNPAAPGGVEVTEPLITPLGEPAQPPPVDLWRPGLDAGLPAILDHAAVTWRHPARRARWELAAASLRGFRTALDELGFTEIQTPKLVSSATESGATVFGVDYFGRRAYLAQSPQFYKQTMVGVFERVYETGPVFRAEPHDTARHLAEYTSLDAELGFISDHRDVLAVLRHALAGMTAAVRDEADGAVKRLKITVPEVPAEIPVVHFREALIIAGAPPDEPDLAPGARAGRRPVGRRDARQRLHRRRGLPDEQAALLHPPAARRRTLVEQLRPALPRPGTGDGRPAPAPAPGLPGGHPCPGRGPGRLRGLPGSLRARHASARRVRDRPRALGGQADPGREHPGGHAVPPDLHRLTP